MAKWRRNAEGGVLEKRLLEAINADAKSLKRLKRMAEHRNHENRPAGGLDKNYRNQALGTAWNRVFLRPRYTSMERKICSL